MESHMSMDIEDDVCDTGLVLGLGYYTKTSIGSRRDPPLKSEPAASNIPKPTEPSLTLGNLSRQPSSPHSPLSSFTSALLSSAKRENESDGEEDGGTSTRKKLRLTKEQSALLEDEFRKHSTVIPKQKLALAKQLNLRPRQVEVWFQNRRARTKLKQTEEDREFLKRCCERLSNENRRLRKELQELRAVKSTPSKMYTHHLTSPILTACPSCARVGRAGDRTTTNGKPFGRGAGRLNLES